jgi:hypothetical protein
MQMLMFSKWRFESRHPSLLPKLVRNSFETRSRFFETFFKYDGFNQISFKSRSNLVLRNGDLSRDIPHFCRNSFETRSKLVRNSFSILRNILQI